MEDLKQWPSLEPIESQVRHVASFSGGKDSTAMVLRLIEEDLPLDEIVFFDTGWEFPAMYAHIDKFEQYINRPITRLHPREPFDVTMSTRPGRRRNKLSPDHGQVYRYGSGWPTPVRRWCTREKTSVLRRHCGDALFYVGIAYDEPKRLKQHLYPLVDWKMTEADCLRRCRDSGFDFGGLYQYFSRVSCFCCPLKALRDYRTLRQHFPELWTEMLDKSDRIVSPIGRLFHHARTVRDLDARFAAESDQQTFSFYRSGSSLPLFNVLTS